MCLCKITVVCKCVRRMHSVDSMISVQIMAWLERVGSCSKGGRYGGWVAKARSGKSS